MSDRKLRRTIKPPARLGDSVADATTASLLQSMHQTREENAEEGPEEFAALPMPIACDERKKKQKGQKQAQMRPIYAPHVVDFVPNQSPASFPSLPEPRPSNSDPKQTNQNKNLQDEVTANEANDLEEIGPQEGIPRNQIENYVASNSEMNPTYVRNMKIMAGSGGDDEEKLREFKASDLEEPKDASAALNAKIDNPKWKDIGPALQVEIVENFARLNNNDWEYTVRQLEIGAEDWVKLRRYLNTRNQQIARENWQLEEMMKKQLDDLMAMDHSDLRGHAVPPQLVLHKQMNETIDNIVKENQTNGDLLMCQAYEYLAAREYLHRRSLDRSLAGDWGNDIVVMQDPAENDWPPHKAFQWAEDLTLKRRQENENRARNPSKGRVPDARNMPHGNQRSLQGRGRGRPDSCANQPQSERLARLTIGPDNLAEIHERIVPAPKFPTTPIKGQSVDARTVETPSKTRVGPRTLQETKTISSLEHPDSPIARSEGFHWTRRVLENSMDLPEPSVSQHRFNFQMEQAWLQGPGQRRQEKVEDGAEIKRGDGTSAEGQQNVQDEGSGTSTSDPAPAVNSEVNAANQSNGEKTTIKYTVLPKALESFADQFFSPEPELSTMADVLRIPWRYCTGPLNSDEEAPVISPRENVTFIFSSNEDDIGKSNKEVSGNSEEDVLASSNEDALPKPNEDAPAKSNEDAPIISNEDHPVHSDEDDSMISAAPAAVSSDEDASGISD